MSQNLLILIGSPKAKNSTSNLISKNLEKKLTSYNLNFSKLYLFTELHHEDVLLEKLAAADTLILISPVYENSVPSTVLQFFELAAQHKEKLAIQNKLFFTITLTGFADTAAGKTTINSCKLFSETMHFSWLGGITTSPSALIEDEDLGKMYAGLNTSLDLFAKSLSQNMPLPPEIGELNAKSILPSFIYRIIGSIYQKKPIKTIGKEAFYAKPLI
ncbi:MAG: NAD(P)H-dependent oxidoreductase [Cellulosilyticum sp.]|nr:NAD(P)H-dependent oxidoreductase [Cellulosilyticum sp.]